MTVIVNKRIRGARRFAITLTVVIVVMLISIIGIGWSIVKDTTLMARISIGLCSSALFTLCWEFKSFTDFIQILGFHYRAGEHRKTREDIQQ